MRGVSLSFWKGCPGIVSAVGLRIDVFVAEAISEIDSAITLALDSAAIEFDALPTGCSSEVVITMVCAGLSGLGEQC